MEKLALEKIEEEENNNNVKEEAKEMETEPEQLPLPYANKGKLQKAMKCLQENPVTKPCCPPTGEVATTLTLLLTIIAIFLAFWTMLGPEAFFGGTIFAFLVIIFLSFLSGKLVILFNRFLLKVFKVNIGLPPMLGMLLIGILLENIPYNVGTLAREECRAGFANVSDVAHNTPAEHLSHSGITHFLGKDHTDFVDPVVTQHIGHGGVHGVSFNVNHDTDDVGSQVVDHYANYDINHYKSHGDDQDLGHKVNHASDTVDSDVHQDLSHDSHDDIFFDNEENHNGKQHSIHRRFPRSPHSAHHEDMDDGVDSINCGHRYIGHDLNHQIKKTLRSICLTVILLMEGLELDPVALKNLSFLVVKATFIPCLVEALAVGLLTHLFLDFPWTVSFMVGFIIAEVSPAVIIPCMSNLQKRGYGVDKGIPSLVIAACSGYEVVAVSGFGIFMGLTFSQGGPAWKLILQGPIEVFLGVSFGVFWGFLAQWIPNKDHHHVAFFRWLILLGGGLIALFGSHLIDFDAAGGLATIIMAFVAGIEWRREGWDSNNPVSKTFHRMWIILEPAVFALIGTEIEIKNINPKTLGLSILVLVIALMIRTLVNFRAVKNIKFNAREKIFMAIAWMPKATMHGPIFLDHVLKHHDHHWENPEDKEMYVAIGNDILTMSVLSILITAPLGASAMLALGPKMLETNQKTEKDKNEGKKKTDG